MPITCAYKLDRAELLPIGSLYANGARRSATGVASQYFGCCREDLLSVGQWKMVHPEDVPMVQNAYKILTELQESVAVKVRVLKKGGIWAEVMGGAFPVKRKGVVCGYVVGGVEVVKPIRLENIDAIVGPQLHDLIARIRISRACSL